MQFVVTVLFAITLTAVILAVVQRIRWRAIDFWLGHLVGIAYFILIPFLVLILTGSLAVPPDFLGSQIPVIYLDRHAEYISLILLIILGLAVVAVRSRPPIRKPLLAGTHSNALLNLFVVQYLLVSFTVYFISGLAEGGHWYRTREEFLQNFGLGGVALVYLIIALRLGMLALLFRGFLFGAIGLFRVLVILVVLCAVDLYTTGNRIFTLQAVVLLSVALLANKRYKELVGALFLAVPIGYFMSIFRWIRSYLHADGGGSVFEVIDGFNTGLTFALQQAGEFNVFDFVSGITESVNVNVMIGIFDVFPEKLNFLMGESLAKVFTFWIPRSVWGEKTNSITLIVGDVFSPGVGVGLITTLFGEFYANFGWFFIVLYVPLLIMVIKIVRILFRDRAICALVSWIIGFTLVRMAFSDVLIAAAVTASLLLFNMKLIRIFSRSRRSPSALRSAVLHGTSGNLSSTNS